MAALARLINGQTMVALVAVAMAIVTQKAPDNWAATLTQMIMTVGTGAVVYQLQKIAGYLKTIVGHQCQDEPHGRQIHAHVRGSMAQVLSADCIQAVANKLLASASNPNKPELLAGGRLPIGSSRSGRGRCIPHT